MLSLCIGAGASLDWHRNEAFYNYNKGQFDDALDARPDDVLVFETDSRQPGTWPRRRC